MRGLLLGVGIGTASTGTASTGTASTEGGLWHRMISAVIGRPQDLPEQAIGDAYEDAYEDALLAVGLADPDTDRSRIVDTVEPDGESRELYPATRGQMYRLAGLQKGGGDVVA